MTHLQYRNFWLVDAPRHGQYPPLYPLVLALTGAGRPGGLATAVALNIFLSVTALGVFAVVARRWFGPTAASAGLAVAALNPDLAAIAGQARSEPMLMACFAGLAWVAHRRDRRATVGSIALAIASALTRTIGVTLIAGLVIAWLAERRWRDAAWAVAVSAVLVGGWLGWSFAARSPFAGQSYWADALYLPDNQAPEPSPLPPDSATVEPAPPPATPPPPSAGGPAAEPSGLPHTVAARVVRNAWHYLRLALPSLFALPRLSDGLADTVIGALLGALLAGAGLVGVSRREPFGLAAICCYGALLLLWPYRVSRFLLPLVPLIGVVIAGGAARLTSRLPGRLRWLGPVAAASLLVAFAVRSDAKAIEGGRGCDRSRPFDSPGCYSERGRGFFQAVGEAARITPQDALILTPKMATVYYLAGRRAVDEREAASLDPEGFERLIEGRAVKVAILSGVHDDQWSIARTLAGQCGRWALEREFGGGSTLLLRRSPGLGRDSLSVTCDAILRFLAKSP